MRLAPSQIGVAHYGAHRQGLQNHRRSNKFENMGAQMVREVASKTSEQAGDGTTTATILADDHPARDAGAVASRGFPPLLPLGRSSCVWGNVRA